MLNIREFSNQKCNFHSHTFRCGHAVGTDREYVEAAIAAGFRVLGFSDHAPYFFGEDFRSRVRMGVEDYPGYVESVLALKEEYRGQIDIRLGLETEYFPAYFDELMERVDQYPLDYMILGQHFLDQEPGGIYPGRATGDEFILARYVEQIMEGLDTNRFLYVAHPDIINFVGDERIWRRHMLALLEEFKRRDMPVEINGCGMRDARWYPGDRFVKLAVENGNDFIVGVDAHDPTHYADQASYDACAAMVTAHGGKVICL